MSRVYRIQDRSGRGPWRPGLTAQWCDKNFSDGVENLQTFFDEFGIDLISRRRLPGEHCGCAVRRLQDIKRWFSATEMARLKSMGFNIVSLHPDRILAESKNQIVFASKTPLAVAGVTVSWDELNAI